MESTVNEPVTMKACILRVCCCELLVCDLDTCQKVCDPYAAGMLLPGRAEGLHRIQRGHDHEPSASDHRRLH